MTEHRYRGDIDGLRAIAVTVVVAYHVGVPGFGGGFVGVDVFFVISGFLITTLLISEVRQRGSIDLIAFYVRRARRLLPAFFLVVAVTLLLGTLFLAPINSEQQSLARSAIKAALYISNLHFARTTDGYFADPSELMPLLHTWSLAVEEQFYFIWPVLLLGCAWVAHRRQLRVAPVVTVVLAIIIIVSLAYSHVAAEAGGRRAQLAFFALPGRAWELAIGALLALALPRMWVSGTWVGAGLAGAGLIAIVAAVGLFEKGMPFPGVAALLPTIGAAAVISGVSLAPKSSPARLLSARRFVGIGLLSYSWYLWHWPLLALARAHAIGVQHIGRDAAIALAALGLAWLTYTYVEQPIRSRRTWGNWSKARVLGAGAAASLLVIAGSQGLRVHAGQLAKTEHYGRVASAQKDGGKHCFHRDKVPFVGLIPRDQCLLGPREAHRHLVVWGDSHADHFAEMLLAAGKNHKLSVLSRVMGGCPPLFDVVIRKRKVHRADCPLFNAEVLAEIDRAFHVGELAGVVLSARWTAYLGTRQLTGEASEHILEPVDQSVAIGDHPAALAHGLKATIRILAERGIKVLVMAPVPEHRYDVPNCLARRSVEFCSIGRGEAEDHRKVALAALRSAISDVPGARLWDPFAALCDEERCLVERDGIILYRDDDHLTYSGSRWLARHFVEPAAWLAGATRESKHVP